MRLPQGAESSGLVLLLTGVVIGLLVAGLAVPMTFGSRVTPGERATTLTDDPAFGGDLGAELDEDGEASGLEGGTAGARTRTGASTRAGGPGGPGAGPGGAAGGPGATDRGVTAAEVRIGFLVLDVGSLSRVGIAVPGVDPEQQREAFEVQLAEVNERGGLHGRRLVGTYESFDVLSQDDMRRACIELRDRGVFGIVAAGGFFGPPILCITEEGRTPFITFGTDGIPTEYVRRSNGLLFSLFPVSERLNLNWVAELDRLGILRGKRVGVVAQDNLNPGDSVVGGELVPALRRFGQDAVHVSRLSGDQQTAASQIPVEVQQMRTQDVDLILLTSRSLNSSQWVQTADNQRYWPDYVLTDWASMNNDTSNQNMPDSYDGSLWVTTYRTGEERVGIGENPAGQECRRIYEEGTGRQMEPKGSNEHGLLLGNCTALKAFLLGVERAGPELTRPAWSRGMQSAGEFPMSMWGGGSYAPGKFGAADLVRTMQWFADCRCLKPTSDFRRPRF